MSIIIQILLTVLIFGLIIFIHELGHFIAAKSNGIKVHEFALGMGPTLFKFGKKDTKYALRLFPIGGFVSMEGEHDDSEDSASFNKKSVPRKISVIVAGAIMNLLLGFVIMVIVISGKSVLKNTTIKSFNEGYNYSAEGLKSDDKILKINNTPIYVTNDINYQINAIFVSDEYTPDEDGNIELTVLPQEGKIFDSILLDGEDITDKLDENKHLLLTGLDKKARLNVVYEKYSTMTVLRDGKKENLENVRILFDNAEGKKQIGFTVHQINKNPITVVNGAFWESVSICKLIWKELLNMFTGKVSLGQLSGPVGVASAVGAAAQAGISALLMFTAFLTINVGIFNLLPFPALDGGRLIFLIIEAIRRKPLNPKIESTVNAVGLILLFTLMIVITFKDIIQKIFGYMG